MASCDSKIIIVGAGVFGLSTALWLANSNYRNVTIFDRLAVDKAKYDPSNGCDGASADINKIFATAFGKDKGVHALSNEARLQWLAWNRIIETSPASELPAGITPDSKLLDTCGAYWLAPGSQLSDVYKDTLNALGNEAPEWRAQHFIKGDNAEEERLRSVDSKWLKQLHSIDSLDNGDTTGFLDIGGGITLADKACVFARHLCEKAGVKFVLGDPIGKITNLITEVTGTERRVNGIKTADGLSHYADIVVVAAGGWAAEIVPEAHRVVEATAGTVLFIDVPEERRDIREKFHPDRFPSWYFQKGAGESALDMYGFPITTAGRLKFGFRGRKYTHFQDHPTTKGLRISTPRTKYTQSSINTVPLYGLEHLKNLIVKTFPELVEFGFSDSRMCWYSDSIDARYVIDYVPGYSKSLFICSGDSGHCFKLLPVIGKYVKNQMESRQDQYTQLWKWREVQTDKPCNGLEEGELGPREISRVQMATPGDFQFGKSRCASKL